jgi:peptidyl-prolyl cis-trans isomerase A (cyclophilin A)
MIYTIATVAFALLTGPMGWAQSPTTKPAVAPSPKAMASVSPDKKGKPKKLFAIIEITIDGAPAGKVKIKLWDKFVPHIVDNFVGLAEGTKEYQLDDPDKPGQLKKFKKPLYDGLTFHRIIDGFMIQGGDPAGNGTGSPKGPGYPLKDEFSPNARHDKPGIVSMANSGPNTNGSQFFITVSEQSRLNDHYSAFGEVVEGYDVVEKVSKVPVEKGPARPLKPVVMKKVTIVRE